MLLLSSSKQHFPGKYYFVGLSKVSYVAHNGSNPMLMHFTGVASMQQLPLFSLKPTFALLYLASLVYYAGLFLSGLYCSGALPPEWRISTTSTSYEIIADEHVEG